MTYLNALELIESAKLPSDIFAPGNHAERYKQLLSLVHPDRFPPTQRDRAAKASGKLGQFYGEVNGKTASAPVRIGKWIVERPLVKGDLADLFLVTSEKNGDGVLKIVRSEADNDLMDAETQALKALWAAEPVNYQKYLPSLQDSFHASGRRVNVFAECQGYHSLRSIRGMIPVPFRHIVWMFNRLLSVIGFSERAGYVHGGITPDHLLYHPKTHGLVLVGWCSAVSIADGEPVRIAAKEWITSKMYPEEVLRKWKCGAGTNIFMAAKSMLYAADEVPERFRGLLSWCTAASPAARPQDAWEVQNLWLELAEQEYGKPKYLKLELPVQ